jgi:excisionase family DNA binding protein
VSDFRLSVPDDFVEAIATAVAAKLSNGTAGAAPSPWLDAKGAAEYLACSVSRVRTLTMTGDLPAHRDGGRPLYHRDELDAYVRKGGAKCP